MRTFRIESQLLGMPRRSTRVVAGKMVARSMDGMHYTVIGYCGLPLEKAAALLAKQPDKKSAG